MTEAPVNGWERAKARRMLRFLPWRFVIRRAAKRYGFMDPVSWLARLRAFAQRSEVQEPLELLRAGIVFHARGLVNVKAIQHNLDWVWPFWVERQFKPGDPSFVPRAFSFSHINLTHRNWTAVGIPGLPLYPIVDPRGLVTPLHDGWSLDFWVISDSRVRLLPSKLEDSAVTQELHLEPEVAVETILRKEDLKLSLYTSLLIGIDGNPVAKTRIQAESPLEDGWLIVAVRPYNPEGVQFIDEIRLAENGKGLVVNGDVTIGLSEEPNGLRMAHYADGDIYLDLNTSPEKTSIKCVAGMATAAALFKMTKAVQKNLEVEVSLKKEMKERNLKLPSKEIASWDNALSGISKLEIPDAKIRFLYQAAIKTLVLLSADELVPGPNTYRRFWFRDACLMLNPMLVTGMVGRAKEIIDDFPMRQNFSGYFLSQEGEWDSNGQVLWIAARYAAVSGERLSAEMEQALVKGVRWLSRKRIPEGKKETDGPAGLLPAGFSAEHLGPNDFYYWDDFWALGGLRSIVDYWKKWKNPEAAHEAEKLANEFSEALERSIAAIPAKRARGAVPAAPSRRLDAGAIGSMVADYPLQLYPAGEARMMGTATYLMEHCSYRGGFFQEMIHSGINAYLTLDLAQTLLRAGDPKYAELIRNVADLASPTGQWPEAIHPNTLGGCMGDGQHGWAAGEWIMMIRNCFVREEETEGRLVVGSGIFPEWLENGANVSFGPTHTLWGVVSVEVRDSTVTIEAQWKNDAPPMTISLPGYRKIEGAATNIAYPLEKLSI
jgi:hypothetical protein